MIKNWGFADQKGNEITRGWQGYEYQAQKLAQEFANSRGEAVSYWDESDKSAREGEGESAETLRTVEPE